MKASAQIPSLGGQIASFCRARGIEALYVFGSRAGEVRDAVGGGRPLKAGRSDVDIAVKPAGGAGLSARGKVELAAELERLLGAGRVDLLVIDEADPFLAVNIIRGERLYCRDEYAADEYELYVLRRAGDLAPFERERLKQLMDPSGEG